MPYKAAALRFLLVAALCGQAHCAIQFNTSGANNLSLPLSPSEVLFTQITTDLHRFTKTGIHIDMVEQPYCSEREPSECAICTPRPVVLELLPDLHLNPALCPEYASKHSQVSEFKFCLDKSISPAKL